MSKLPKAWVSWRSVSADDPRRLSKVVAHGIKLRDERKELEAMAEALKKEEQALKEFLIENFNDGDLREVKTTAGVARLMVKVLPQADLEHGGWDAIYAYIKKTGAFDLLQKRLHEAACKERWDDGKQIPGVKQFIRKDLKLGDAE